MAYSPQFNLRWNNHSYNIVQVFLEQLSSESLVDVTLSCQGQFIKAHKMVLSACSPYFQDLFIVHQGQHPVIILNGMKFNDLKMVVDFMYRGETRVMESELSGLLAVAEALQVKGLSNVRNKYERGQISSLNSSDDGGVPMESTEEELVPSTSPDTSALDPLELSCKPAGSPKPPRKRKRTSEVKKGVSRDNSPITPSPKVFSCKVPLLEVNPPKGTSPKASPLQTSSPKASPKKTCGKSQELSAESSITSISQSNEQEQKDTEVLPFVQVAMNECADDDDLATTIKVEPLFIRDIDDADTSWDDPARLVIDLPPEESEGKKSKPVHQQKTNESKSDGKALKSEPVKTSFVAKPQLKLRPASELVASSLTSAAEQSTSNGKATEGTSTAIKENIIAVASTEKRGKGGKIPRPPNAFMIFANEWRRKLALENPQESNKQISVRLGLKWKNLTSDKKEFYFCASRRADEEHKRKYPNYYYSPKEARIRKSQMLALRQKMQGKSVLVSPTKKPGLIPIASKQDPLYCVKTYMRVSNNDSTNDDSNAIYIANIADNSVTVKEEVMDDETSAQNLEEEFLKMVEEGHVEAEIEEDSSEPNCVSDTVDTDMGDRAKSQ